LGHWKCSLDRIHDLGDFVIRHIDGTADPTMLKQIAVLADTKCPDASKDLCSAIASQTRDAIASLQ
jgi:hypothetical protein